jgi:RNA polymerase sigma factor (sigma-70 family)
MTDESSTDFATLPDEALLGQFIHEGSENAFRTIVERYGPFVLSTCRRAVPSASDADDAFQTTFLVLAQSARKVRNGKSLAAWLYGVASRVCTRICRDRARHRAIPLIDTMVDNQDPLDELLARHDESVTDEALALLPEKLRTPLILRYLLGKSNVDVAEELEITVTALEGRLKRAKKQLRLRLIRQGVTLVAAVATLKATRVTAGEVPQWLISKTIVACCNPGLTQASGLTAGENSVTQLALEEIKVMNGLLISKPMAIIASITTAATFMVGVQLAVSHSPTNDSTGSPLLLTQTSDHQAPVSSTEATTFQSAKLIHSAPSKDRTLNTSDAVKTVSNSSPIVKHTATYDLMPRTTSEMKIYQALDLPLVAPLEYTDVPLLEILNILSDDYDVQILLDRRGMEDIGISGEVEVSMNVRNIQLKSALRLMLRELELTCIIRDEVLVITTQEVAESMLETRVYLTIHLSVRAEDLTDVIISTVAAGTWAENGNGEGQIKDVDNGLVILQTQSVHEEIQQLLGQLTKLQD